MKTREELEDRIAQLEEIIGLTAALPLLERLRKYGATPIDVKLLGMLVRRPFVPHAALYDALYGGLPESQKPDQYANRSSMKRLRKALEPFGVEVKTSYGEGYYIDQENKQKLLKQWPELAECQQRRAA